MRLCRYCGRENDEEATHCSGCGTSLASGDGEAGQPSPSAAEQPPPIAVEQPPPIAVEQPPPIAVEQPPPIAVEQPPPIAAGQPSPSVADQRLGARSATLILLVYFGVQVVVGVVAGMAAISIGEFRGLDVQDPGERKQLVRAVTGPAAVLSFMFGGVAMLVMSRSRIRPSLSDTSSTGAAWVPGSLKHIAQGMVTGAVMAGGYCALSANFQSPEDQESLGPIATMAVTPGLLQLLWLLMALALAPVVEELLFRGVLYGGYRSSFGPVRAAFLTTAIFWVLHLTEMIHFWPAMLGIAGLAIAALWFRLRSAAIGPAVAVHFGYNGTLAVGVVASTWT